LQICRSQPPEDSGKKKKWREWKGVSKQRPRLLVLIVQEEININLENVLRELQEIGKEVVSSFDEEDGRRSRKRLRRFPEKNRIVKKIEEHFRKAVLDTGGKIRALKHSEKGERQANAPLTIKKNKHESCENCRKSHTQ